MPSTIESTAPWVVARFQYRPEHQRHEGADQRDLVGARHQLVDRRALHARWHRPARSALKTSTVTRMVRSSCRSLMPRAELAPDVLDEGDAGRQQRGRRGALDGRQQRAEEQHLHRRTASCSSTSVGSTFCGVVLEQRRGLLRHDDQRAGHEEHRHEGEQDVADAADHRRRCVAASALLADITRWNTSCCGMEPSIMVMAAAKKNSDVVEGGLGPEAGTGRWLVASAITLSAPPARSPANTAMTARPDHQHDHLDEVGQGHRPQAAEQRVDQDRQRADHHAQRDR